MALMKIPNEAPHAVFGDLLRFRYGTDSSIAVRVRGGLDETTIIRRGLSPHALLVQIEPLSLHVMDDVWRGFSAHSLDEWASSSIVLEWGEPPTGPFMAVAVESLEHWFKDDECYKFVKDGLCPRCGDDGYWHAFALVCRHHKTQFI